MRCGACSSNASTIAGFATSTTWNSVSSRSGVASTRTSLTEQFDSGVFDYARVSVQTAATLSTNCNWCFSVRTAKATFPYWKLMFLSSIFTALHIMQTRYSDENSVRPSVRIYVRLSVRLSQACIGTKRKKDLSRFLYHTKDNLA